MNKTIIEQNSPDISIDTNIITEVKKAFTENWSTLLTKNEQQILKVLYFEKSALNVYEIRRHLIFSTSFHIITEFTTIQNEAINEVQNLEWDKLTNKKQSKKFIPTGKGIPVYKLKTISGQLNEIVTTRILTDLRLSRYKDYPTLEFSPINARNFAIELNKVLTEYKNSDIDDTLNIILANKTSAEELLIKILSSLKIEIFGFSTISSVLENLRKMKIVLMREVNIGKSKTTYFINPILIKNIQ